MLKNLEYEGKEVEFKAPLVVTAPTYNIIDELKIEGDWSVLQKYSGFEFDDLNPKSSARIKYENMMYLERPGCNLCMGNQEKLKKEIRLCLPRQDCLKEELLQIQMKKKGNHYWPQHLFCTLLNFG